MSRVRGKKRMEIIKKFLEGEEDPDYEVIPTVTEGKYFVKPRKKRSPKRKQSKDFSNEGGTGSEEEDFSEEFSREHSKDRNQEQNSKELSKDSVKKHSKDIVKKHSKDSIKQPKPPKHNGASYSTPYYDPTISYQILEQLKLLGEEQRQRRQKKEQKKLVKHQIQKQMSRTRKQETESEESDDEYYEPEPELEQELQHQIQVQYVTAPSRRRVNLLK